MATSKLSAKAARLDFSKLPGALDAPALPASAAGAVEEQRPKTAPGAMMAFANDARSELLRENEALRQRVADAGQMQAKLDAALGELGQWDGAKAVRQLDPTSIRTSAYANRHEANYSGPDYLALRAEIESAGGNVQPIKVRGIAGGQDGKPAYELVYGHRRHRACLELGLPVLALVDNVDDRAMFVEMDRENRSRKDLSAWEQGVMYRKALAQGLFPSNRKLAEALGVDLSALGKALAIADLPLAVVEAFHSPMELQYRFAKPLMDALARNRDAVLQQARALKREGRARKPREVLDQLVAAAAGAGQGVEPFHPPVSLQVEIDGRLAATLRAQPQGGVAVQVEPGWLRSDQLGQLSSTLERFLRTTSRDT